MRTQTAREKAEALVALIRQEFPNPRRMDDYSRQGEWYCVATAAYDYHFNHDMPDPDSLGWSKKSITEPNDEGRFEDAWLVLTDCYEDKFIKEMT